MSSCRPRAFHDWVTRDGSSGFPAERGRYHLYISHACPFSARAVIARRLKSLDDVVSKSALDPYKGAEGWAFTNGEYADPIEGFRLLSDVYEATVPSFDGSVSVPVLWDRQTRRIVSNQSGDIARMLGSAWDDVGGDAQVDPYPPALRSGIDALNRRIDKDVNNAVYAAGMASTQDQYERAYSRLFTALDELELRLERSRFLLGPQPTECDWRLFASLVRLDTVYALLFKCNRNRLPDMPNLWGYARDLYQWPGIAQTVRHDEIKRHYYSSFPTLNPSRIVPRGGPPDFAAPHERAERFGTVGAWTDEASQLPPARDATEGRTPSLAQPTQR